MSKILGNNEFRERICCDTDNMNGKSIKNSRKISCWFSVFSLVELLVVIAIIAILIAILMPALKRAKEQAKTTECASRLKQYGYGATTYATDNNLWLPAGNYTGTGSGTYFWNTTGKGGYAPRLGAYVASAMVDGASSSYEKFGFGCVKWEHVNQRNSGSSYGWCCYDAGGTDEGYRKFLKFTRIVRPAVRWMICDAVFNNIRPARVKQYGISRDFIYLQHLPTKNVPYPRHLGYLFNALHHDSHVASFGEVGANDSEYSDMANPVAR